MMSTPTRFLPRERRTLVADALLFAAAFGGAGLALVTLLAELVGDGGWYEPASIALMVAAVILCPLAAWRLHGHAASRFSTLGALLGVLLSALVVMATAWAVAGIALGVSWVTADAVSMGVAALVVSGLSIVALLAWLDTDAVRDLAREHRHVGLDVGRLAATAAALVTVVGTLWWAARTPGEAPGELLEFSLVFGIAAATVALAADLTSTWGALARHGSVVPPT